MMFNSHVIFVRDPGISFSSSLLKPQTHLSSLLHLTLCVLLNSAIYLGGYGLHVCALWVDLYYVDLAWSFSGYPPGPLQEPLCCTVLALRIVMLFCVVALMVNCVHHLLYFSHDWWFLYGYKKLAYTLLEY
jgi:hypothetical protein